ncbi:cbb3-type cytochrome oxidase assembly protein CcoS [Billgrantia endophytica]|uniref:Cbb3-type cytochrome oxidase assembly protein CcoS n=1 Tax=Billgrantia endophytica TaxID=2033802 RepID=A0A2N7U868_9GAMM|nr:cbb3-type cytochrome oxidase assembly protein CcoS [Halomonas endophytica]PMR76622.1 cbb3-type cytochrome oxidase assembly protein CcoS [Halomonas endophytica]
MTILYLLIPLSLILLGLAVWAFFWAVKNDQFEDLEGPAHRILFDEDDNDLTSEARARRQEASRAHSPDSSTDNRPDNSGRSGH